MKRTITVITSYGSLKIVNLNRVWVNSFFGYNLMYSDENYEYNCIYCSYDPAKLSLFRELKTKLWEAYNSGKTIVEL